MSRRRRIAILAAFALIPVIATLVAAPVLVVERLRSMAITRCEQRTGAQCTLARVSLGRDGVVLHGLLVRLPGSGITVALDSAAVRVSWLSAALGHDVLASVVSDAVTVRGRATLAAVRDDLVRLRGRPRSDTAGTAHRTVGGVSITGIAVDVALIDGPELHVANGAVDWSPDSLEVRWPQARASLGTVLAGSSGACLVVRDRLIHRSTLDCTGSELRVDTGDGSLGQARAFHQQISSILHAGTATAVPAEEPAEAAPGGSADMVVSARDGTVVWSRGDAVLARLTPATVTARWLGGSLREVHAGIGQEAAGTQPVVGAHFLHEPGTPWRVDVDAATLPLGEIARLAPGVPWHDVSHGLAQVHVHAEPEANGDAVMVDGSVELQHFGLDHPRLAHGPIDGLSVRAHGAARIDVAHRRVEADDLEVAVNGISVGMSGWVEHRDGYTALDVRTRVPTLACDAPRTFLPEAVTGPITGLELTGTIAADVHLAVDTRNLAATVLDVAVEDACAIANDTLAQGVRRFSRPFVQRVQEPQGLRAFVTGPGSAAWVAGNDIAPAMIDAVVAHEDGRFYRHAGFDVTEIRGAIVRDLAAGRFVYGASTLSMQLAKNIFLQREKTLVRKLQEVVFTWYLERVLGKEAILELYLNVVEFGPGIYGIGPASRFFFDCEPRDLTPLQAVYLATLLPAPVARFGNFQRGAVSDETLDRLRLSARAMGQRGVLSPADADAAQTAALTFRAGSAPTHGPLTENVDPATLDESLAVVSPIGVHEDELSVEEPAVPEPVEHQDSQTDVPVRRATVRLIPPSPY